MKNELLDKGRLRYIHLNKKFLEEVEKGNSWQQLQPILEEMKSLAIYLQQIPASIEIIEPAQHKPIPSSGTTELKEEALNEDLTD